MFTALWRKKRIEKKLKALDVPLNVHLPRTESEAEMTVRTKEEIIDRIIPLTIVAAKALEAPPEKMDEFIDRFNARPFFTEEEQAFIAKEGLEPQDQTKFSWRLEAILPLLWSVNLVSDLDVPGDICDPEFVFNRVLQHTKQELLDQAELQPISAIADQIDFIYRAHWAVRDAQINEMEPPAALNADVVMERHHALNWLVHYLDQEWDDVTTDT